MDAFQISALLSELEIGAKLRARPQEPGQATHSDFSRVLREALGTHQHNPTATRVPPPPR